MGPQLFIGNLTADTDEADLRAAFTAGGFEIGEVKMLKDPDTGRRRGLAFVELASAAALPHAIERLDRYDVRGRAISVRAASAPRRTVPVVQFRHALVPKQVLLVEDDPDLREVTRIALVDVGYSVVEASNGRDAIDRLVRGSCRPAAILLDMTMPIMDGRGFMTELQELRAFASVVVVLLSAQDDLSAVAAALGAAGHLRKPIHVDQLTELLTNLEQRASGISSNAG
jgi:CheY-like chemotaxis protein